MSPHQCSCRCKPGAKNPLAAKSLSKLTHAEVTLDTDLGVQPSQVIFRGQQVIHPSKNTPYGAFDRR